ncbi:MAG TPA: ATP-binding protein [Actinomycetota bacterium]|nr:ATP-binding protein [Actinomycetota bacterium]
MAQTLEAMHRFDIEATDLAARRVRRELEALDYEFPAETVELLKLVATELVTNAVRHARTEKVVVFVRVGAPSLLVKVCDRGPGVDTHVHEADLLDEGGRGLFLVEAVAESWGTSRVQVDGAEWACVWACFGAERLPGCVQRTA